MAKEMQAYGSTGNWNGEGAEEKTTAHVNPG
jgi:hypothetical protein